MPIGVGVLIVVALARRDRTDRGLPASEPLTDAVTKVRRRLAVGAAAVILAVLLVIGVPISELVADSPLPSAGLWWVLAGAGALLLLAASFLEAGRVRAKAVIKRIGELLNTGE